MYVSIMGHFDGISVIAGAMQGTNMSEFDLSVLFVLMNNNAAT